MTTFVVDRSERGKLALTGSEAKDFLHGQVTNDIVGLTPGHGCYAAFLTHKDCDVVAVCDIYQPYVDFAAKKVRFVLPGTSMNRTYRLAGLGN